MYEDFRCKLWFFGAFGEIFIFGPKWAPQSEKNGRNLKNGHFFDFEEPVLAQKWKYHQMLQNVSVYPWNLPTCQVWAFQDYPVLQKWGCPTRVQCVQLGYTYVTPPFLAHRSDPWSLYDLSTFSNNLHISITDLSLIHIWRCRRRLRCRSRWSPYH